jgi:hypothetical protein
MMTTVRSPYSSESINEVCSSTASLSVSSNPIRDYDSPTVVSFSSGSTNSYQFEDAPEDYDASSNRPRLSLNPLDALAMACAAEQTQQELSGSCPREGQETASNQISHNDVLCGRGGLTNHHPGNVFFRRLVRMKQEAYLMASKREKAGVAKEIVDIIRKLSPPGRFLKKDPQNPGAWIDIGDRKAREKTSQALREGAPELREELQSSELQADIGEHLQRTFMNTQLSSASSEPPQKPPAFDANRARIVSADDGSRPSIVKQYVPETFPQQPHVILDDQPFEEPPMFHTTIMTKPYHHPQPMDMDDPPSSSTLRTQPRSHVVVASGMKRKPSPHLNESIPPRGPRLKLLKQRLQESNLE